MKQLNGKSLLLEMNDEAINVRLVDKQRDVEWLLDESTRLVSAITPRYSQGPWKATAVDSAESQVYKLGKGTAEFLNENSIRCSWETPAGRLVMDWIMEADRLRVVVEAANCSEVTGFSLPGTFRPADSQFKCAIPNCQGILHTGKGPEFYSPKWGQESMGFSLSMFGQIAAGGSLVSIAETDKDATLHWEKTAQGDVRAMWRQESSMGGVSYDREVVIMPADANLTATCKAYRRYEIEKGRFASWEQKLEKRPGLEYLFGACLIFIGYWEDPDLDYEAGFRKLRAAGIDRALVYPLYMDSPVSLSGAVEGSSIDQRKLIPLINELGYKPGGFIYVVDGPEGKGEDKWKNLRLDENGQPRVCWQMNDLNWYNFSNEERLRWASKYIDNELKDMDWLHYDVLTGGPFLEDYNQAHRCDARAEAEGRAKVLDYATDRGMIVSSEGFWGRGMSHYDLGNTKRPFAIGRDEYAIVPMTMLVYHDSAYHTWWEVDNYNNPEHRSQYNRGYPDRYAFGGGFPRIQSAMDAIMGTPPDIFPFGRQWSLNPHSTNLYMYNRRLEDELVDESIAYAKRVMDLNAKTGKLELVEHILHTPDGAVQESVFADGTRVIANFANVPLDLPGIGRLEAESWVTR